jgi:hypothetical protein
MPAKKKSHCEAVLAKASETIADLEAELREAHAKMARTESVCDAEVAFWKKEAEHLQQRLADAVVAAAVKN